MNRLVILLLILSPIFSHAQKRLDLIHDNAFVFFDYQEKAFCVLDDSTFIWKYDATKIKWQKVPLELSIDMPFAKFLSEFIPMSENGTPVYFVHGGCGVVYALNKNKIFRHDHSFYHMNQFEGAFFMDEGEPRIYGGYGLFTSKNIITRYDTIEREWFVLNSTNNPPPAGVRNNIQKNKRFYYVFDGFSMIRSSVKNFNYLHRFDLISQRWENLGKINPNIPKKKYYTHQGHIQNQSNLISCFPNVIVTYDFDNLRYKKYHVTSTNLYQNIIKVDSLYLLLKKTSSPCLFVEISTNNFLKNLNLEEGNIILDESNLFDTYKLQIIVFLILIALIIVLIYRFTFRNKTNRHTDTNQFIESNHIEFNQVEIDLIKLLKVNNETGLEISFINDLVNQDQPSIDTLKKRRESLLKELRYKLAMKFNIPQEEIFIEKRMISDKRMKLLFLNESVLSKF